MRLAQIARKLKIKTSEVVTFVEQKFEDQIVHAPNTKIPDAYVNTIIEHFTVDQEVKSEEVVSSAPATDPEQEEEILEVQSEEVEKQTDPDSNREEEQIEKSEESEIAEDLNIEDGVVKAPKAEVKGIKVVGKIELQSNLPEETEDNDESEDVVEVKEQTTETSLTKEKSEATEEKPEKDESIETVAQEEPTPPVKKVPKKQNKPKKDSKSLTYEEERTLRQKAYRDELQRLKKIDKNKKKANYDRMMQERTAKKSPKKSKASKSKKEDSKPATKITVEKQEAPKTMWGKFIYWLNN